jgi:uncharacterized protein (DUF2062 family)
VTAPSWWQRRVVAPILAQLRQGITPQKVALTLALGAVLGIFPILGATTLLCAVAGIWLRLNQPAIQLVNYLVYPVQLALLIPFYRAGERLFGAEPVPIVDVPGLVARFGESPLQFLLDYGMVGLYGIAVWGLVALPLAALLYAMLRPILERARSRLGGAPAGAPTSSAASPPPPAG